jgi:hypothetical protein
LFLGAHASALAEIPKTVSNSIQIKQEDGVKPDVEIWVGARITADPECNENDRFFLGAQRIRKFLKW